MFTWNSNQSYNFFIILEVGLGTRLVWGTWWEMMQNWDSLRHLDVKLSEILWETNIFLPDFFCCEIFLELILNKNDWLYYKFTKNAHQNTKEEKKIPLLSLSHVICFLIHLKKMKKKYLFFLFFFSSPNEPLRDRSILGLWFCFLG